jgi:hybrid cluster-associated redox disulfide protein
MAANNHGLDLDEMIRAVRTEIAGSPGSKAGRDSGGSAQFDSETLIGKVLEEYPSTRVIFERYLGDGCFDCPGQAYESIDMACRMHGVDPNLFIEELRAAAGERPVRS